MGGTRWGDDYLAARRPDGVPSRREGEFVLLGYEDLGVGVDVQVGPLPGWRVPELEKEHVRAAVERTPSNKDVLPRRGSTPL